jgi:septal ring factor EnvC (AmiA/AmiB activator)
VDGAVKRCKPNGTPEVFVNHTTCCANQIEMTDNAPIPCIPKGEASMAETASLMTEILRSIQANVAALRNDQKEVIVRLGRIEVALASQRRDIAHGDEGLAEQSVRLDRINERIERIERRLELA